MRLAVFSDTHGNYDAFEQVLKDIEQSAVDEVISLGDNIGYGPEPDRVIKKLKALKIPSVRGNHELAVEDEEYLNWFNPAARKSLIKTRKMLSKASLNHIAQLEPFILLDDCRFVHGFPPDSSLIYMFQVSENRKQEVGKNRPNLHRGNGPVLLCPHPEEIDPLVHLPAVEVLPSAEGPFDRPPRPFGGKGRTVMPPHVPGHLAPSAETCTLVGAMHLDPVHRDTAEP